MRVGHGFGPVFDSSSRVLILGSFPSVKSREIGFYYGHPQNRFWRVLGTLLGEEVPDTVDGKRAYLLRHGIALWDVIESCEIVGSSDASVKDPEPTDLSVILSVSPIERIFCNGKLAYSLLLKYGNVPAAVPVFCLPSTSPANAAWSLPRLCDEWREIGSNMKGD